MRNKSLKRILALIALIVIVICLAGLILSAFLGSDQRVTLAFLFLIIVVPCIIFIFIKFTDSYTRRRDEE